MVGTIRLNKTFLPVTLYPCILHRKPSYKTLSNTSEMFRATALNRRSYPELDTEIHRWLLKRQRLTWGKGRHIIYLRGGHDK